MDELSQAVENISNMIDNILASNPVERSSDDSDRIKYGESFMVGVYKMRLEMLINDIESLKFVINNE
jgi:hypothetical protein